MGHVKKQRDPFKDTVRGCLILIILAIAITVFVTWVTPP